MSVKVCTAPAGGLTINHLHNQTVNRFFFFNNNDDNDVDVLMMMTMTTIMIVIITEEMSDKCGNLRNMTTHDEVP